MPRCKAKSRRRYWTVAKRSSGNVTETSFSYAKISDFEAFVSSINSLTFTKTLKSKLRKSACIKSISSKTQDSRIQIEKWEAPSEKFPNGKAKKVYLHLELYILFNTIDEGRVDRNKQKFKHTQLFRAHCSKEAFSIVFSDKMTKVSTPIQGKDPVMLEPLSLWDDYGPDPVQFYNRQPRRELSSSESRWNYVFER